MDDEAVGHLIGTLHKLHDWARAWEDADPCLGCGRRRREQLIEHAREVFPFMAIMAGNRPFEDYLWERRSVIAEAVAAEAYQRDVDPKPLAAAAVAWRRWFDDDVQEAIVDLSARLSVSDGGDEGNKPPAVKKSLASFKGNLTDHDNYLEAESTAILPAPTPSADPRTVPAEFQTKPLKARAVLRHIGKSDKRPAQWLKRNRHKYPHDIVGREYIMDRQCLPEACYEEVLTPAAFATWQARIQQRSTTADNGR